MKLVRTWTSEAIDDGMALTRLSGEVRYADGFTETAWFEFPTSAGSLSSTGNPWLIWMLPLAATLGESIEMDLPIDAGLHANAAKWLQTWLDWYPALHPVKVEAPTLPSSPMPENPKSLTFFTGGVDSFYTILKKVPAAGGKPEGIDALVYIWGYDIKLDRPDDYRAAIAEMRLPAQKLGLPLIEGRSNLRQTRLERITWERAHGVALGAVALCLEKSFQRAFISSTHPLDYQIPYGSHLDTDPLMGSSCLEVVHYGAEATRAEKMEFIAQFPVALDHLRCCGHAVGLGGNCGKCHKCYRTMLTLDLLGVLKRCRLYADKPFDVRKASRLYCHSENSKIQARDVRKLALRVGRLDVAQAIESALLRTERLERRLRLLRAEGKGKWAKNVQRFILAGSFVK